MIDKKLILNELINYYASGKIGDFAKKIGVSQQVISNWKNRNTYDAEIIYTNCENLSAEWLLTGKGSMIKDESNTGGLEASNFFCDFEELRKDYNKLLERMEEVNRDQKSVIEAQKALIDNLMTLNRD